MTELVRKTSLEDALASIPVFPLPQVVLFPESLLPLHVFEPRYRAMLKDCLEEHGALVVAQLLAGEDAWGQPRFAEISGGGVIIEHQLLSDGRSNIVVLGRSRLRLEEIPPTDPRERERPYRRARATILESLPVSVPEADRTALVAAATMFAGAVQKHDPTFSFVLPPAADADRLADVCASQLVVDAAVRQAALEELDPRVRVQMVLDQIAVQHGAIIKDGGSKVLN